MLSTDYMALAIEQARLGGPATYTNPQVGAVLVKDNQVVAMGYHHHFGGAHAEVATLAQVSAATARNATLYVTLEPCSHFGKTPPCCRQVVAAGIKQVIIGQLDPHPIVAGRGRDYLKAHGVKVTVGCLAAAVKALNPHYNWFYQHNRPWITVKAAVSLDGKLTATRGQRSLVTNHASYLDSQQVRSQYQAIVIGERTLTIDDPALTVRLRALAHPPVRIVLLHDSSVAIKSQLVQSAAAPTWLLCRHSASSDAALRTIPHVHVQIGDWTPAKLSTWCATKGIQSVLVEGGSRVQADFVAAGLVEEVLLYIAPTLYGGQGLPMVSGDLTRQPVLFEQPSVTALGTDLKIVAFRKGVV